MGPLVMLVLLWVWQTYALANEQADHRIASWYSLPGPLITLMACKGRVGIPHCPPPLTIVDVRCPIIICWLPGRCIGDPHHFHTLLMCNGGSITTN